MRDGRQLVVILYSHPLLGEGLGRLLAGDPALQVELVRVSDLDQARQALSSGPEVVILERTTPVEAIDLLRLAPSALLIDVGLDAGPTWTYRRDELAARPEDLLRVIHDREGQLVADLDEGRPDRVATETEAACFMPASDAMVPVRHRWPPLRGS